MAKKNVTVRLEPELVIKAKEKGINLSKLLNDSLKEELDILGLNSCLGKE